MASAAAMAQPSGRAIPALIPDTASSVDEHVALASAINPFAILLERATSDRTRCVASWAATRPAELNAHRSMALAALIQASDRLEPQRAAWRALAERFSLEGHKFSAYPLARAFPRIRGFYVSA